MKRGELPVSVLERRAIVYVRQSTLIQPCSRDVGKGEAWLVTHPDFRRDPKVRVTADFLRTAARGPAGLC